MHSSRRAALAALSALLLAACSGGESSSARSARYLRCAEPGDSVVRVAVAQYIKSVQPLPRRFVIPIGGGPDSLPEPARQALQDAGPTFLYPRDSVKQRQLETQLLSRGDWPTLLVALRDLRRESDSIVVVRLGGRFVSGELDERPVPTRAVRLACRQGRWVHDRTDEERSS